MEALACYAKQFLFYPIDDWKLLMILNWKIWLLSLKLMFLRFIHVVSSISSLFIYFYCRVVFHCMSISLFVNKYLDCFHLYTIMNNPTINILIQVVLSMCIFISLKKNQGMEFLDRKVSICLTRRFSNHFPKWLFHFISLDSILYTWLCHLWIKTVLHFILTLDNFVFLTYYTDLCF